MGNIYEKEMETGMYIQYIPSEHIWKVVEDMKDDIDISVSESLEKIGFGSIRRFITEGIYKGNMTNKKIDKIREGINKKRMDR